MSLCLISVLAALVIGLSYLIKDIRYWPFSSKAEQDEWFKHFGSQKED